MEKRVYSITIDAPREKVWQALWNDASYREWTSVFSPGSYAETDWKKGSKVLFLNGEGQGMASRIADNIPNEYMSIEHLGFVADGKEDYESEKVKEWAGAKENYTLKAKDGKTEVVVDLDITDEYAAHFDETWPKALEKLKAVSER